MAYPVASVIASSNGTASATQEFGEWFDTQLSGDYILIAAHQDGGGTPLTISSSHASDPTLGWVEIGGPAPDNSGSRTATWYRLNTGTTLAAPILSGATDDWAVGATLIRDADTTTFLCASGFTEQTAATLNPVAPSVTTTTDGCLILRILGRDGSNTSFPQEFGVGINICRTTDNPDTALNASEIIIEAHGQPTSGATGTYTWDCMANDGGRNITLAIRNKTGGGVLSTPATTGLSTIFRPHLSPTVTSLQTWHATMFGQTVQTGVTGTSTIIQVAGFPQRGIYGGAKSIVITQPATTGPAGVYGVAATLTSTQDLSDKITCICFRYGGLGPSTLDSTGPALYFRDNAGGWAVLRPFNKVQTASEFSTYIAHLPTETQVDGSGTIDWSSITHIGTTMIITGTVASNASRSIQLRSILTCSLTSGYISVVGGNSANPCTPRDLASYMGGSFGVGLASAQGNGQNLITLPVRIGDGSTPTIFAAEGHSLEYPVPGARRGYSVRANDQKVLIKASASDNIDLTAGIFATTREQNFIIDSSSSTSATYGFAGTYIGWNLAWKDGIPVASANFISCDEIDAQSSSFNTCIIKETTSSDAAIAYDANSSMDGTTINVVGTTAAYHLELGSAVTAFTLTDVSFVGTAATNKVHVKATSGTVTITLAGTTSLTSGEVTSDGATITIVSGAQVTLTGLVAGSEVRAYVGTPESSTVIDGTESCSTSFTFSHSVGGQAGFIVVRKLDYKFIKISLTYSNTDASIPVQQVPDPWYANP